MVHVVVGGFVSKAKVEEVVVPHLRLEALSFCHIPLGRQHSVERGAGGKVCCVLSTFELEMNSANPTASTERGVLTCSRRLGSQIVKR